VNRSLPASAPTCSRRALRAELRVICSSPQPASTADNAAGGRPFLFLFWPPPCPGLSIPVALQGEAARAADKARPEDFPRGLSTRNVEPADRGRPGHGLAAAPPGSPGGASPVGPGTGWLAWPEAPWPVALGFLLRRLDAGPCPEGPARTVARGRVAWMRSGPAAVFAACPRFFADELCRLRWCSHRTIRAFGPLCACRRPHATDVRGILAAICAAGSRPRSEGLPRNRKRAEPPAPHKPRPERGSSETLAADQIP